MVPKSRFLVKTNTIIDTKAGLEWVRYPMRLREFSGLRSYERIEKELLEFNYAGHKDWRLPSKSELWDFVTSTGSILADQILPAWFWTSTPKPLYQENFVIIFNGHEYILDSCTKTSNGSVRPVRTVKNSETKQKDIKD